MGAGHCYNSISSSEDGLIANAGNTQYSKVGSYAILDGSKSSFSEFNGNSWFDWECDPENPVINWLSTGNGYTDLVQPIYFIKKGTYKFHLTITENEQISNKSTVKIVVGGKGNSTFEDHGLEALIRYRLQLQVKDFTKSDYEQIDSIGSYKLITDKIKSVKGIQNCSQIEYLSLSLQSINNIESLSELTNLKWLALDQNWMIKDVSPLSKLYSLTHLNLDGNQISNISPLTKLTQLKYLNLMYNVGISDISPVQNMINLEELWFSNSPIQNIDYIKNLTKLKNLWLANCNIADINAVSDLTELRSLFININNISDISPLEKLTKLERLYSADNRIYDISSLSNLININWLILPNNQIENIKPLIDNPGLSKGDFLLLSGNPLNEQSINEYIPLLINRGVTVTYN